MRCFVKPSWLFVPFVFQNAAADAGTGTIVAMESTNLINEASERAAIEMLRRLTPEDRLRTASGMWIAAQKMLLNLLANEHPEWSDERVKREVAHRLSHGSV